MHRPHIPRRGLPKARGLGLVLTVALCAQLVVGPAVRADSHDLVPDQAAAEAAAREIAAAQDRANAAAEEWTLAEYALEDLEAEASELESELQELQATVDTTRQAAETAAVERYMASSNIGVPLLTGYQTPMEQLQTEALAQVATGSSLDAVDQLELAQRELGDKKNELEAKRHEVEEQRESFEQLHTRALEEVENLQKIEAKRLEDERVRIALEKQRREEERRRREEEQRRLAEEAAKRKAEEERRAAELARENERAAAQARDNERIAALAAASQQAPQGRGEAAAEAAPTAPAVSSGRGIVCPVQGPTAYADTWGAPRSGGRRHEGVDMISPEGTPLVAAADGEARFSQNRLGGNAVNLSGDNGDRYYYAHLSAYEGSSRRVRAGEVIGYVGSTGNTTVDHLHFEVHPGGGAAVNPTPYVRNAGC